MATTKRPQINVRASAEQIAGWKEAATAAGSFNGWAVAALDAAADGNGHPAAAVEQWGALPLGEPIPPAVEIAAADRFDRDRADQSEIERATARLETAIESLRPEPDTPRAQRSRAGRCARRRFHRAGSFCKSCRTMT